MRLVERSEMRRRKKSTEPQAVLLFLLLLLLSTLLLLLLLIILLLLCVQKCFYFSEEEICHVVNVVCISLHVCERKMKSEMAFYKCLVLFIFHDFKASFFIFVLPFPVSVELRVVEWLTPFYNSARDKTYRRRRGRIGRGRRRRRKKKKKRRLGILKEKRRL